MKSRWRYFLAPVGIALLIRAGIFISAMMVTALPEPARFPSEQVVRLPGLIFRTLEAAAQTCVGFPSQVKAMDKETITVSSTSKALTAATYATTTQTADIAVITFDGTNKVRYWPTGDPTSAVGHLIDATSPNVTLTICGRATIVTARFIRVTNDATISVSYYTAN